MNKNVFELMKSSGGTSMNVMLIPGFATITSTFTGGEGVANCNDNDLATYASATVSRPTGEAEAQVSRYYTATFASAINVSQIIVKSGSTRGGDTSGNWGGADTYISINGGSLLTPPSTFNVQTTGTYDSISDYPSGITNVTSIKIDIRSGNDSPAGEHNATVWLYELKVFSRL
jgi:hypothetical protein